MVILASIFTLTPAINTQNVKLSFIAIITCVVTYYLNDLSLVLGKTNKVHGSCDMDTYIIIIIILRDRSIANK